MKGNVGVALDFAKHKQPMIPANQMRPVAAHLAGCDAAAATFASRPFDHARHRDPKRRSHLARRLPTLQAKHRKLAQINRIGLRHPDRPPAVTPSNLICRSLGIPIQTNCERL